MFKLFFTCVATLALSAATLPAALADTPASLDTNIAQAQSAKPGKTSDRTPGDPAPHRTPGANVWGAAGVDSAHTVLGTSDRTPANHYLPATH
jgi:hypothetical protein